MQARAFAYPKDDEITKSTAYVTAPIDPSLPARPHKTKVTLTSPIPPTIPTLHASRNPKTRSTRPILSFFSHAHHISHIFSSSSVSSLAFARSITWSLHTTSPVFRRFVIHVMPTDYIEPINHVYTWKTLNTLNK